MKPAVFVGSSSESHEVATAIQENLDRACNVTVWDQGIFSLSQTTIESLTLALERFDFAVFVFTPDDLSVIRDESRPVVRDNVLFELGLFCGHLGRARNFIVLPRGEQLHMPTDLLGLTAAVYDKNRRDSAGLGVACSQILQAVRSLGPVKSRSLLGSQIISEFSRGLTKGATKSVRIMSGDASWAERDRDLLESRIGEGISVKVLSESPATNAQTRRNIATLLSTGASVRCYSHRDLMSFRGRLIDSEQPELAMGMTVRKEPRTNVLGAEGEVGTDGLYEYTAALHYGVAKDREHVKVLHSLFETVYANSHDAIVLEHCLPDIDELLRALRKAPHYLKLTQEDIALELVQIDDLYVACKVVSADKLERTKFLVEQFTQQGQTCFNAVRCLTRNGRLTILPPIIELNGGKHVLIDGAHRMFARRLSGNTSAYGIVLKSEASLPSVPVPFRDVRIVAQKLPRELSFNNYDRTAFRPLKSLLQDIIRG